MAKERLYKTIFGNIRDSISINFERVFFFLKDEKRILLEESEIEGINFENTFALTNDEGLWEPSEDCAKMDFKLSIKNTNGLFGDKGVLPKGSRIGVGIEWRSNNSIIKKHLYLGSIIENKENSFSIEKSGVDLGVMFTGGYCSLILFSESLCCLPNQFYASEPGMILLDETLFKMVLKGAGSAMPISFVSEENKPLWWIDNNIDSPYDDLFEESNIRIIINRSNPNYPFIDDKNVEYYNPIFHLEIMGAAMSTMMLSILSSYEDGYIDKGEPMEGSVHQAMKYISEKLGVDFSERPEEISKSILSVLGGYK